MCCVQRLCAFPNVVLQCKTFSCKPNKNLLSTSQHACQPKTVFNGNVTHKKLIWWSINRKDKTRNIILYIIIIIIYAAKSGNLLKAFVLTSLSSSAKATPRFGMALRIATSDWIVLLKTTGRYCLKSSGVNPLSWMIFICLTIVLFPDSPAPENKKINRSLSPSTNQLSFCCKCEMIVSNVA